MSVALNFFASPAHHRMPAVKENDVLSLD